MSGGDPIANIKLLEGPAKNLAVSTMEGKIFKTTLSKWRDAQASSSGPKRMSTDYSECMGSRPWAYLETA